MAKGYSRYHLDGENDLEKILKTENKNWQAAYLIMKKIHDDEEWRIDYDSFSHWLFQFAEDVNVERSTLWNKWIAGKLYDEYCRRKEDMGEKAISITSLNVSADTLVYAKRLAGNNTKQLDGIIDKVSVGEIKRENLRRALKSKKLVEATKCDSVNDEDTAGVDGLGFGLVILKLEADCWIEKFLKWQINFSKRMHFIQNVDWYRSYSALDVKSDSSNFCNKLDFVVVENMSVALADKTFSVNVHCVVVALDEDTAILNKLKQVNQYADYTWLCTSKAVAQKIIDSLDENCGILIYDNDEINGIEIYKKARKKYAQQKMDILMTTIQKR